MRAPKLIDGDFVIEKGEWIFVEGDEEFSQSVKATMTMRKGEFFLEEEAGMNFDNILGKHTNEAETRDDIIEAISQEERVRAVTDLQIETNEQTRKREITVKVEKDSGELIQVNAGNIGEGVN